MRYDEFLRRYKAAYRDWQLGSVDAREALSRLSRLVPDIDDARAQETARFLIGRWEAEASPAAQERMERALRIAADAEQDEGSPEERIARLESGMRSIAAVARETDDEFEQYALLALNEPLARLAAVRHD
jgi:hypothetical protein